MTEKPRRTRSTKNTSRKRSSTKNAPSSVQKEASLPLPSLSVTDVLLWHSIPRPLVQAMSGSTIAEGLSKMITFGRLPLIFGKPMALGGASGSGKTLTLAKLAARYALQAQQSDGRIKKPVVLACDKNPGSYVKLASILQGYDVELIQAYHGLMPSIEDKDKRIILVDLPGVCIYSKVGMTEMMEIVNRTQADLSLVIPAGMDPEESTDIAATFRKHGAQSLIASRLEQSGRIGGVITAAACGLRLTYGSYSSHIEAGFAHLTPQILAKRLLILPGQ
ncbi:hypothetical protein GT348_08950 (plasmid) [Aristophania vespae]|uniref:SRP54-type proteins GTP-binding domain-containing protein n=1 Tax=Aristophania vespae TaxID=2697033 RepID=A0A6P1NHX3_9PROT|nr:hypothetical protein [Aristophania vespae]QHI96477.1 hypothetical protein GT348_08950 [Aristophania vespae]UMM64784.1 hypothetical protein DM15PD_18040 [Aristophania vespae]